MPTPNNAYLKNSIIGVIGFNRIKIRNLSGTVDNGYTTGLAYISKLKPKLIRTWRSLYLVVRAETIIPIPILINPKFINNSGKNNTK
tara:strand:+ start:227 stop:487 length:261 start_codon:yes stop_codon:yes gene_type:complete